MSDIIQQLLDLKEWSQNPERYERRLNFRGAGLVGTPTKEVTQYGRRIYETPEGEEVSEKSTTFFINGMGWINIPSIHGGRPFTDDQLRLMIKSGTIEPTSIHQSKPEAEEAAGSRSNMMKRHEKGFAGGQLVQPGPGYKPGGLVEPGVTHYSKEDFIRNPEGKNQWVLRTDDEIQKIIDNPQYEGWTKKDFRNKEILTRVETEREGLKFQHYGKKKDPTKVRIAQTKRTDWIKEWSNYTTEQKLAAMRESGLELSHIGSKADLVTLNNLAYLPKYTNKLSYFRFEKILNGIQADQNKILADTTMSVTDQRAALAELAKADRTLRKRFKGQGYDKIKSRIKTREFAWGMGKKEVIIDPSITIGKGEVGANIPLKTASKAEKGKMVALGKENIKTQIKLLKEYLSPESRLKSKKVIVASTLNKFLTSKGVDICG